MKHKLIEIKTGAEVKPGMNILSFRNEIWKLESFKGSKLTAVNPETGWRQEFYPTVFDLKIVEAQNDPFDN